MNRSDYRALCRGTLVLSSRFAGSELAGVVYRAVYAGGYRGAGPIRTGLDAIMPIDRQFVGELRRRVPVEIEIGGWERVGETGDGIVVSDGRISVTVTADMSDDDESTITVPALSLGASPGFVARLHPEGDRVPTRCYLNVRPDDAWVVLGPVTEALDIAGIPASAKVLAHPAAYARADSAVVYVPAWVEPRAIRIIEATLRQHEVVLSPSVPAFTLAVESGFGIADEPTVDGGGPSHGQWVTGLLLEAAGVDDETVAAARLWDAVVAEGRNPAAPHRRGATHPAE